MLTVDTSRFKEAEKYASYLKTTAGRLRTDLAWRNLRSHFRASVAGLRALDLGGGTGALSVRLAALGFQVELVDSSEEMLTIAKRDAESEGMASRIAFRHGNADRIQDIFEAGAFDVIVCHNVLEYVNDPDAVARSVGRLLRENGVASFLVRNRAGEVLKAAAANDWARAKTAVAAPTVLDSLFGQPVRVFSSGEIRKMIAAEPGVEVAGEFGVRVFSDYANPDLETIGDAKYVELLNLESDLGARPEFAAVARYSQFIVQRSSASPGKTK
jgi:S-adenosylmethionine-dependent methyltransferase